MKRLFSALISVMMILSCAGTAFADQGISNQIIDPVPSYSSGAYSAAQMIRDIGYERVITMPNPGNCYESPVAVYIDAPKNHSIYVYKDLKKDKDDYLTFVYEGQRVAAIAEQKDMTCILFASKDFRATAGWVETRHLSYWFPGTEFTVGEPCVTEAYYAGDASCHWSGSYFVGTEQKFTMTDAIENCVQFKLNYQLLDRGGAGLSEVARIREIYVNDGSGWQRVGQFSYSGNGAVQVTVNLPKPMDLRAVATVALCDEPDAFFFRQTVLDVFVA